MPSLYFLEVYMIHKPISDHVETNVCIEFEALFDIPFGILRMVRQKFNDPSIFEQYWMQADTYTLRCLLYERNYYNPIYAAMKDSEKDIESANEILSELMSPILYNTILSLSPPIAMYNMVSAMKDVKQTNTDILQYTVICKNDMQYNYLKEKLPNTKAIVTKKPFKFDLSPYHLIILERYENILRYCEDIMVSAKTIWIPEFWYNMDIEDRTMPSMEISILCGDINTILTYEPYNNFNKPVG